MTVFKHNSLRTVYDRTCAVEELKGHEKGPRDQMPEPQVIAALPEGIHDVTWLRWIENFGTRYKEGQYVMLGRTRDALPSEIDFGKIVGLYRHGERYAIVCKELDAYYNKDLDGYEVNERETCIESSLEDLLDFLPLEGYAAGKYKTKLIFLHHHPFFPTE